MTSRRFTVGADGPETVTPGVIADMIEPAVRVLVSQMRANGASSEAVSLLDEWVASVRVTAAAFRRSVSDECADIGQLRAGDADPGDPGLVHGYRASTVADRLHLDQRSVTRLVGKGLTGQKVGREWVIDPDSVAAYQSTRGDT